MEYRDYQLKYIDNIQLNKSNIVIATMGSGKSLILKGIVDKYFFNKKVLVITNRRNLTIQLSAYFPAHTFILSGKNHDTSHNVHLATFQTFQRRNFNLEDYDLICVDEIHETYNIKLVKKIRKLTNTRLYLTGTPINAKGEFLGVFDNALEFTNMQQMIEDGYLAKTRFISKANILSNEEDIGTRNGDYIEADVERVIDKQAIVNWLVKDNQEYKWSTKHKAIMYVNSIATANKIAKAFNEPENIKAIHSKLTKKESENIATWFNECKNGILINVRMYTTGSDVPSCDTIINVSPTKIISLYLQSIWRGSRAYGLKETTVYDYSGNLFKISPYYHDWYKKPKPTCTEKCKEFPENSIARHMCLKDCKPNPDHFPICDGKISYTMEQNPYISGFKVMRGKPCKQGAPVWQWNYKTTEPKDSFGKLIKWAECPNCGCVTAYRLETITQPSNTIEMYQEEIPQNSLIFIFNSELKKGLLIVDDMKLISYKYIFITSQMELYEYALQIFKGRPFTLMSNIPLNKLANVTINTSLNDFKSLVNWESTTQNIMRKILTYKLEKMCESFNMKKGYVYYMKKNITDTNIKKVFKKLNSIQNKYGLITLNNQIKG